VDSRGLVEEPISSELVLVDRELALRARVALPEPPWLLPVLAELEHAGTAEAPAAVRERPAPAVAHPPPPQPVARRPRAVAVVLCLVLALAAAALGAWLSDVLRASQSPGVVAGPAQRAAEAAPAQPPAGGPTTRAKAQHGARPTRKARSLAGQKVHTKPGAAASAPRQAAKPKPRALGKAKRVFSWRRYRAAVYYQFYFQRGAKTIYQARTVKLRAALPARLKLRPGTYRVLVRPAIPSDAGIILGAAIVEKTMRV
jgi:hypothetical protein